MGHDDAEAVANVIGTERATEVTRVVEQGTNSGKGSAPMVDRYIVNPNSIKQLETGEAVILAVAGGRRWARLRVGG